MFCWWLQSFVASEYHCSSHSWWTAPFTVPLLITSFSGDFLKSLVFILDLIEISKRRVGLYFKYFLTTQSFIYFLVILHSLLALSYQDWQYGEAEFVFNIVSFLVTLSFFSLRKNGNNQKLAENLQVWYKEPFSPWTFRKCWPDAFPMTPGCVFSTNKDIPLHDHSTIIKHQEIYTDIVLHVVLRLKQCISDWDLSPPARLEPSENPPSVNWSHTPGFRTYEAQVLDVSSQKEFSERQIDR